MLYNVYCDESCHLEYDNASAMGLGAVYCPQEKIKEVNRKIIDIKIDNEVNPFVEMKWTKISPSKEKMYMDLINFFFDCEHLRFRGVIVPNKSILDHEKFNQTHDDWYYKMYYEMLKALFYSDDIFNIYIDIKDTNSYRKSQKLHEVCCNSMRDFERSRILKVQPIRSHEVQIMQIVDVIIGALVYIMRKSNRETLTSTSKVNIIKLIRARTGYSLLEKTPFCEEKFNMLPWEPKEGI